MSELELTDAAAVDRALEPIEIVRELYPICRSITGNGVRETLRRIREWVPVSVKEVATGTKVFDWTVPREWNIRDAWVKNGAGERVIDFQRSNLHVVNYSVPVRRRMSRQELGAHLHTLSDHPDWIPYKTSYYAESWGFCVSATQAAALQDDEYDVCIDSTLEPGSLTYGELLIPGETPEEVLLSTHVCHPSLCNDNLSGIAMAVLLARWLAARPSLRYSYRLLFVPGTIGSITWLALNQDALGRIHHGLVLTGLGGPGGVVYKRSRRATTELDRAAAHVLANEHGSGIRDFSPYGYDERQYCSPGINLPVGRLSRTPFGEYPEYHTSADNFDFVTPVQLQDSLRVCQSILGLLEDNRTWVNQSPMCEPQLGRRGLFGSVGGAGESRANELALLWVLNLSDGTQSLLDIAERSGLRFDVVRGAADRLHDKGLLEVAPDAPERVGMSSPERNL